MIPQHLKNRHLLSRAGFGIATKDILAVNSVSTKTLYDGLEKAATKKQLYINVAQNAADGLIKGIGDIVQSAQQQNEMSAEEKQKRQQKNREDFRNLNTAWLTEMVYSDAQLLEKMALFWHGHFACRIVNTYYQQLLLHEIRTNALGSFGNLLLAVSKTAAMLNFLNNQQNKKEQPNENFAREVMELFTLGRGNYTEQDIKEAARAFTGWGFNLSGEFVVRPFFHDSGQKTIFGKTGNFDGEVVIDMLLQQKQTARFITRKLYKYFVNETVDEDILEALATTFYDSGYDIKLLMRTIFTGDWFYDAANIGTKIKSPVELLVGIRRILPMELKDESVQILMQRIMGQLLFSPPNVAGWAGGKSWIDSSTLMIRLRLPQLIKENSNLEISTKPDDDKQGGRKEPGNGKGLQLSALIDWPVYHKKFQSVKKEDLFLFLQATLLQTGAGSMDAAAMHQLIDSTTTASYIETATIALMSTPEYQMC